MSQPGNKCYNPECNGDLSEEGMCRQCGATRQINPLSGNVMWTRGGRILAAFQDEKDQWVKMAKRNGVPEADWPERFRTEKE